MGREPIYVRYIYGNIGRPSYFMLSIAEFTSVAGVLLNDETVHGNVFVGDGFEKALDGMNIDERVRLRIFHYEKFRCSE